MKLLNVLDVLPLIVLLGFFGCHHATEPPLPAPPDTTSHEIIWTSTTLGDLSSHLNAVWGTSAKSIWAVGKVDYFNLPHAAFVVHYDGEIWKQIYDDSVSFWVSNGFLSSIHGTSDSCWTAVGSYEYRDINGTRTFWGVAIFWDGHTWHNLRPATQHVLLSVWMVARDDIYAGGADGSLLHYDGKTWNELSSPTSLQVWRIFGLPTGEIYAIACDGMNSLAGSSIMRLDGGVPRQVQFVNGRRLFSVWGDKSTAYVTGEDTYRRAQDGSWAVIDRPTPWVTFHSISGTKASDLLVAGAFGTVHHWNGVGWRFYSELYDSTHAKVYYSSSSLDGKYFLVGYNGFNAEIVVGERTGL